jgi:hypothetical protein
MDHRGDGSDDDDELLEALEKYDHLFENGVSDDALTNAMDAYYESRPTCTASLDDDGDDDEDLMCEALRSYEDIGAHQPSFSQLITTLEFPPPAVSLLPPISSYSIAASSSSSSSPSSSSTRTSLSSAVNLQSAPIAEVETVAAFGRGSHLPPIPSTSSMRNEATSTSSEFVVLFSFIVSARDVVLVSRPYVLY